MAGVRADGTGVAWGGGTIPGSVKHVEIFNDRVCALFESGELSCWTYSYLPAMPVSGSYTAMTMGQAFVCAVRTDGTVACFGTDGAQQQFPVPTPPTGTFTRLVADYNRVCGLRTDGSVACWYTTPPTGFPSQIPKGPFVDVVLASEGECGLHPDGSFECWEDPGAGGPGSWVTANAPPGPYESIAVAMVDACGIRQGGELVCWNLGGTPTNPPPARFKQILAGSQGFCGIQTDGVVLCWTEYGEGSAPADFGCCRPDYDDDFSTDPGLHWSVSQTETAWSETEGTFSVKAGPLSSGTSENASLLLPHQSAWADVEVEAVFRIDSGPDGGILVRDNGNAYYVGLFPDEKKVRLRYYGTTTNLAEADADIAYGEYHRVGMSAVGCDLAVSLDGVTVMTVSDQSEENIHDGDIGLFAHGGQVTFDSFHAHCVAGHSCLSHPETPIPLP
jgi:hypothetical protein